MSMIFTAGVVFYGMLTGMRVVNLSKRVPAVSMDTSLLQQRINELREEPLHMCVAER